MPLRVTRVVPKNGEPLELGNLTILVGPNNSGKSQTLRDIRDYIVSGSSRRLTIVAEIDLTLPDEQEARRGLSFLPHPNPGHTRILGVASDLQNRHELAPQDEWIHDQYAQLDSNNAAEQLLRHMGEFWCASLDAESRFRLAAPAESYDTRSESPANALQAFFSQGNSALTELRAAFKQTFSMDIALDWAAMRRLYLRVGPDFGEIPDTLAELDDLLKEAQELSQQGDGYKSFAGVVLAMLAFPNRVLLLDEPEAFLHPAQARGLGRWLAAQAKRREAQVIIASHSSDFLLGIISADSSATVIRLNRGSSGTKFHVVPPETTAGLIQSPLLSSQPVLDSLFHRGVVVCEGDPDRAVYQTVLHQFLRESGGEEVLLIHSNGKDAVGAPLSMLRSAGTPACAIVDIDVLNSSTILSDAVEALTGQTPPSKVMELRESIAAVVEQSTERDLLESLKASVQGWLDNDHSDFREARRALVKSARIKSKWDNVKTQGVEFFQGDALAAIDELLISLRSLGLFVVPKGELEGWMPLGIAKGQRWNRAALEKLHDGECPDDLRDFMRSISEFLEGLRNSDIESSDSATSQRSHAREDRPL